jgi:hypothetical protein
MICRFAQFRLRFLAAIALGWIVVRWLHAHPGSPSTLVVDPPLLCAAETWDGTLRGFTCAPDDPLEHFAPPRVRTALGLPVCWHTADPAALQTLPGVGARTAERLVTFRDRGGAPTPDALRSVPGVGPSIAGAIARAVTTQCGLVTWPSSAPAPARP